MTEKVKVTPKMDELIRNTLKKYERHKIVEKYNSIACDYKNEIDLDTLIKALYIGYEVKPELKIGDFVDIGLFGVNKVAEVTGVKGDTIAINGSDEYYEFKINRVLTDEEKQEEKERRWWKKHGREPWELKIEDVLVDTDGEIKEVTSANVKTNGTVQYCIDYCAYSLDHIKERFIILVFKENRLDVKTDAD